VDVIWTPLTEEELAELKECDSVVIHAGSKDGAQLHPIQRTRPESFYIRDAKFVERSTRGSGILVLYEDSDPIWVAAKEVGRFQQL
jgi:hypothetical protein